MRESVHLEDKSDTDKYLSPLFATVCWKFQFALVAFFHVSTIMVIFSSTFVSFHICLVYSCFPLHIFGVFIEFNDTITRKSSSTIAKNVIISKTVANNHHAYRYAWQNRIKCWLSKWVAMDGVCSWCHSRSYKGEKLIKMKRSLKQMSVNGRESVRGRMGNWR